MTNIYRLSDRSPAYDAETTLQRRLRISDEVNRASRSRSRVSVSSLMIDLFCLCAARTTGFSTKLAKRLFGMIATRLFGRSRSTRSVATTKRARGSSRRHFGFSGER